jgi:hypothetical protein
MFFGRGKNTIEHPYTFADMYKDYISDIDEGSPYYVSYIEYVEICSDFYKAISKAIIDDGITFKLPYGMGEVYVLKKKVKYNGNLPIDWQATIKEGKKIYILNEHTKGFKYAFFWHKPLKFKNKFIYRLVFTRSNKRYLAKAIKQKNKDYFER